MANEKSLFEFKHIKKKNHNTRPTPNVDNKLVNSLQDLFSNDILPFKALNSEIKEIDIKPNNYVTKEQCTEKPSQEENCLTIKDIYNCNNVLMTKEFGNTFSGRSARRCLFKEFDTSSIADSKSRSYSKLNSIYKNNAEHNKSSNNIALLKRKKVSCRKIDLFENVPKLSKRLIRSKNIVDSWLLNDQNVIFKSNANEIQRNDFLKDQSEMNNDSTRHHNFLESKENNLEISIGVKCRNKYSKTKRSKMAGIKYNIKPRQRFEPSSDNDEDDYIIEEFLTQISKENEGELLDKNCDTKSDECHSENCPEENCQSNQNILCNKNENTICFDLFSLDSDVKSVPVFLSNADKSKNVLESKERIYRFGENSGSFSKKNVQNFCSDLFTNDQITSPILSLKRPRSQSLDLGSEVCQVSRKKEISPLLFAKINQDKRRQEIFAKTKCDKKVEDNSHFSTLHTSRKQKIKKCNLSIVSEGQSFQKNERFSSSNCRSSPILPLKMSDNFSFKEKSNNSCNDEQKSFEITHQNIDLSSYVNYKYSKNKFVFDPQTIYSNDNVETNKAVDDTTNLAHDIISPSLLRRNKTLIRSDKNEKYMDDITNIENKNVDQTMNMFDSRQSISLVPVKKSTKKFPNTIYNLDKTMISSNEFNNSRTIEKTINKYLNESHSMNNTVNLVFSENVKSPDLSSKKISKRNINAIKTSTAQDFNETADLFCDEALSTKNDIQKYFSEIKRKEIETNIETIDLFCKEGTTSPILSGKPIKKKICNEVDEFYNQMLLPPTLSEKSVAEQKTKMYINDIKRGNSRRIKEEITQEETSKTQSQKYFGNANTDETESIVESIDLFCTENITSPILSGKTSIKKNMTKICSVKANEKESFKKVILSPILSGTRVTENKIKKHFNNKETKKMEEDVSGNKNKQELYISDAKNICETQNIIESIDLFCNEHIKSPVLSGKSSVKTKICNDVEKDDSVYLTFNKVQSPILSGKSTMEKQYNKYSRNNENKSHGRPTDSICNRPKFFNKDSVPCVITAKTPHDENLQASNDKTNKIVNIGINSYSFNNENKTIDTFGYNDIKSPVSFLQTPMTENTEKNFDNPNIINTEGNQCFVKTIDLFNDENVISPVLSSNISFKKSSKYSHEIDKVSQNTQRNLNTMLLGSSNYKILPLQNNYCFKESSFSLGLGNKHDVTETNLAIEDCPTQYSRTSAEREVCISDNFKDSCEPNLGCMQSIDIINSPEECKENAHGIYRGDTTNVEIEDIISQDIDRLSSDVAIETQSSPCSSSNEVLGNLPSGNKFNAQTDLALDLPERRRRCKPKHGSLAQRMQRLLHFQRSMLSMWKHTKEANIVNNATTLRVNKVWNEFGNIMLQCSQIISNSETDKSCEGVNKFHAKILLIVKPSVATDVSENSLISIFAPWTSLLFVKENLVVVLNVSRLQILSRLPPLVQKDTRKIETKSYSCSCIENELNTNKQCSCLPQKGAELILPLYSLNRLSDPIVSQAGERNVTAAISNTLFTTDVMMELSVLHQFRSKDTCGRETLNAMALDRNGDVCKIALKTAMEGSK